MKFALLLTAMLSGLCAEVMASPIGDIDCGDPAPPLIASDLHFNAGPPDGGQAFPDEDPPKLVTTELDQTIHTDRLPIDENGGSGYLGVPEPPPAPLILSGLTALGFFALGRRARWKRRRSSRRTVVHMRALMAKR